MIRNDWATPPDGDFARYVDQLMARAAQARLRASHTPGDGFDGAVYGSIVEPAGAPASRGGASAGGHEPGRQQAPAPMALGDTIARGLRRWAAPPTSGAGWGRWLQERVRVAADASRNASANAQADAGTRMHDPRTERSPRKP